VDENGFLQWQNEVFQELAVWCPVDHNVDNVDLDEQGGGQRYDYVLARDQFAGCPNGYASLKAVYSS